MSIESKMTYDSAALHLLLANKTSRLPELLRKAEGRIPCPGCGAAGPHWDNGEIGVFRTLCCRTCNHQWEA